MKKVSKAEKCLFCIALIIIISGCSISINIGDGNGENKERVSNANDNGNITNNDENSNVNEEHEKKRLSYEGVSYLVNDGKLIISGNGTVTKEALLSLSHEYNVVDFESGTFDIGDDVFNGYKDITDVNFRNNVCNIGARAFQGTSLALVCFGSSIESIGDKAFADCCIDYVFINNENMYKNFNSRYDFGEAAITAYNVYVYSDLVSESDADDGTAGEYLASSSFYGELKKSLASRNTAASRDYAFNNYVDKKTGFVSIYGLRVGNWMSASYEPQTNVFEYSFHPATENPREGRDIIYFNITDDSSDDTVKSDTNNTSVSKSTKNKNTKKETVKESSEKNKSIEDKNCFICGGTGSKQCTSCHGQGYYYEYDNFGAAGDGGKLTQIKKTCMVCRGSGKVKCYH